MGGATVRGVRLRSRRLPFRHHGPSSLEEARRLQEKYPAFDVCALDAPSAGMQPPARHRYTRLSIAVQRIERDRLRPGAVGPGRYSHPPRVSPARWMDFVFGADPNWWIDSPDGAPLSCMQPVEFWQRHLQQAGFAHPQLHASSEGIPSGAYLLMSVREAVADPPRWSRPLRVTGCCWPIPKAIRHGSLTPCARN